MGRRNQTRRGPLPAPEIRADDPTLTRFSGLVPFMRFAEEKLHLVQALSDVVGSPAGKRTHAVHLVLFAFLVGALAGVARIAHLEWLRDDAVLLKFVRLAHWPVRKVFAAALGGLSDKAAERLGQLVTTLGLAPMQGARQVTVDLDSSVIVSFGEQEGAVFGYCGKGRNRRRHHPLVASVQGARTVVHADYRDGTAIKETETISFLTETIARVGTALGTVELLLRADSGFWSLAVGDWLLKQGHPFIFAIPLNPRLKLMLLNQTFRALADDADVEVADLPGALLGLDARLHVAAVRRRVIDPKAPPQGKVISADPNWRYQAMITSVPGQPEDLWRLYNGRADCERVFKVAKHALGMSWLVSHDLRANETAFLLRLLAYNADILFQLDRESSAAKDRRPVTRMGLIARQRRLYNLAGRLLRAHNRWLLRVSQNRLVANLFAFYAPDLISTS